MITALLAQFTGGAGHGFGVSAALAVVGMLFAMFIFVWLYASHYVKAGPNQVVIISGRRYRTPQGIVNFRIVKGGGVFVFPVVEKYDVLSLDVLPVKLALAEVRTSDGAAL